MAKDWDAIYKDVEKKLCEGHSITATLVIINQHCSEFYNNISIEKKLVLRQLAFSVRKTNRSIKNKEFEKKYINKRFGKWVVIKFCYIRNKGEYYFECLCDCGNVKIRNIKSIKNGDSKSCGCNKDITYLVTHRMTKSVEYRAWANMKTRCYNKNRKQYHRYGGRGIIVCSRWLKSFENFYTDMGVCPLNYSLDRINNDGNYKKINCRWASKNVQASNTSANIYIRWAGKKQILTHWAKETKIPIKTLSLRYHRGLRGSELFFKGKYKSGYKK